MSAAKAKKRLRDSADAGKAKVLQRFFKTGKGEYGEGDVFIGVVMPVIRGIAREFWELSLPDIQSLVRSKTHEERMLGFVILTLQFKREKRNESQRKALFDFYFRNRSYANNWDLIDVTAPKVMGEWFKDHPEQRGVLDRWSRSKNIWERRLAIMCTQPMIQVGEFRDTVRIAEALLNDPHDLIHKASGWMLRECGKRDASVLRSFLGKHSTRMPRTMLRYSIEKLSPRERSRWLNRK
jgi:3-methyladenine DNA glycosylase AlkD